MLKRPLFIGSEIYRHSSYGPRHPLAIPRVSTVIDLCRSMGWLPDDVYIDSPRATVDELTRFHHPDYIQALQDAGAEGQLDPGRRDRYNIGGVENPIFAEIFSRPATAAGASLLGADLIMDGGIVFNPAGGTHHGRPDRASGFCYVNDPVLAILRLLDNGLSRIVYIDVDAHHGDGVQDAFHDDDRVLTISVHEERRWPFTGDVCDRAGGMARNLPVPRDFSDAEMNVVLADMIVPLTRAFAPEAIVLQCGADGLDGDPLSRLTLSNRALWGVVDGVMGLAERLLVLGGGGYNPWTVGRCWAGVWATLNKYPVPETAPPEAQRILGRLSWSRARGKSPDPAWLFTLADRSGADRPVPDSSGPGPGSSERSVRQEIRDRLATVMKP